jgi:hypothetical protein
MYVGSLIGAISGAIIESLILLVFSEKLVEITATSKVFTAILVIFFGNVLVGSIVGTLVGVFRFSDISREFKFRMVLRIAITAGIFGAFLGTLFWGILIWILGGLSLRLVSIKFGILGGIMIGLSAGSIAGTMIEKLNESNTNARLRYGAPVKRKPHR